MADLTATDLLSPDGRLIPKVHFPGQSLTSVKKKLNKFLELAKVEGEDTEDPPAFQRARAYYRAFDEVYQRLIVVAADISVDEGRRAYLNTQLDAVRAERDAAGAEADEMLDVVDDVVAAGPETQSIPIRFTGPRFCYFREPSEAEARRWLDR